MFLCPNELVQAYEGYCALRARSGVVVKEFRKLVKFVRKILKIWVRGPEPLHGTQ